MTTAIAPLRANVRKALAAQSGAGRQLANIDAVFEKALAAREQNLLANVPILLTKSFQQRHAERRTDDDDPTTWTQPGSWLESFCNDAKRMLLAELDLAPEAGRRADRRLDCIERNQTA